MRLVTAQTTPAAELLSVRALLVAIGAALLLGTLVRLAVVLSADFPLNDGGMFYAMTTDLQNNGYRIPEFTTYNFGNIPYAYPPLPFYAAAALNDATGLSMLDTFRFLPLTVNMATMGAFVLLARRLTDGRIALTAAVLAFALNPRSFEWMIMGGGLTRSFGLLFAVLALHEFLRLYQTKRIWSGALAGMFAALTALSHLEMAWFLAFSTILFLAFQGRHRVGAIGTIAAGGIAVAITAIWWIPVLLTHGFSPYMAAAQSGSPSSVNPVVALLAFRPTDEPMFPLVAALALMGGAWCISRREWLLPLWVIACGLLGSRGFGNLAAVPLALLAGMAVGRVVVPVLAGREVDASVTKIRMLLPTTILGFLALYSALNALVANPDLLSGLNTGDRVAMAWAQAHTPPDGRFLLITDDEWYSDQASEWFPVVAERQSVATVQGAEWMRGSFAETARAYADAQDCANSNAACLERWRERYGLVFDYVYLPKDSPASPGRDSHPTECCAALRASLRVSAQYEVVFDGGGATIFAPR